MNPVITITGAGRRAYQKQPGPGVLRAALRLLEHRASFSHVDLTPNPSQQQRRAAERADFKAGLHNAKMAAMRAKKPGGAATFR